MERRYACACRGIGPFKMFDNKRQSGKCTGNRACAQKRAEVYPDIGSLTCQEMGNSGFVHVILENGLTAFFVQSLNFRLTPPISQPGPIVYNLPICSVLTCDATTLPANMT